MNNLIPVNNESVYELENLIHENQFPNVEQFISMYNIGMLNPNFDKIKELANKISDTYKNIKLVNRKFIIKSASEVAFDNTILLLENWKIISTLKRVALQIIDENYPSDTKLIFLDDKPGYLMLEFPKSDGELELKEYWLKDKLFSNQKDLIRNYFLKKSLYQYGDNPNDVYLNIESVLDVDDSFILDIEDLVKSNTLK